MKAIGIQAASNLLSLKGSKVAAPAYLTLLNLFEGGQGGCKGEGFISVRLSSCTVSNFNFDFAAPSGKADILEEVDVQLTDISDVFEIILVSSIRGSMRLNG